jgi:hypothetical protein
MINMHHCLFRLRRKNVRRAYSQAIGLCSTFLEDMSLGSQRLEFV